MAIDNVYWFEMEDLCLFPLPYIYFTPRWENSGIFSAFPFIKQSRGNEGQVSPMVLGFYFIFILFLGLVEH